MINGGFSPAEVWLISAAIQQGPCPSAFCFITTRIIKTIYTINPKSRGKVIASNDPINELYHSFIGSFNSITRQNIFLVNENSRREGQTSQ
jgi:hypothetical protein